jgi:exoribonuclease R
LDSDADVVDVRVERAAVTSRAKLNYPSVQADVQAGRVAEPIALLPEIGALLIERGLARGAINLPIPTQEVVRVDGGWDLVLEAPRKVEEYNAQISLLTGMAAAKIMLDGGCGLLRTMPKPDVAAIANLRAAAHGLGIAWPDGSSPGRVIGAVDGNDPRGAAFLGHASELMRGAGYTAFEAEPPAVAEHGGVGAPYAHVTAPLRRLADRFATEAALALFSGQKPPDWVREALPKLPEVMTATDHVASAADRGAVDLAESVLLQDRVGQQFDAAVLDLDQVKPHHDGTPRPPRGVVAIDVPAVRARCEGEGMILGDRLAVRLITADPVQRKVLFATTVSAPELLPPGR